MPKLEPIEVIPPVYTKIQEELRSKNITHPEEEIKRMREDTIAKMLLAILNTLENLESRIKKLE